MVGPFVLLWVRYCPSTLRGSSYVRASTKSSLLSVPTLEDTGLPQRDILSRLFVSFSVPADCTPCPAFGITASCKTPCSQWSDPQDNPASSLQPKGPTSQRLPC